MVGKNNELIVLNIESNALKNNIVNENVIQELHIYIPPSYYHSNQSYPVVYYLHGYTERPGRILTKKEWIDLEMKSTGKEFIIVEVNGYNKFGGSYYYNSPVTGNWEDFLIHEVIPYIDNNFRTKNNAVSKGISGYSMGGFAAIRLALKYPNLFSAVITYAPAIFAKRELNALGDDWNSDSHIAYGAVFSPNVNKPYPHVNIPLFDNTDHDLKVIDDWLSGFGNLDKKIKDYLEKENKLNAIKIIYGKNDYFKWIPNGCEYLRDLLKMNNINHEISSIENDHQIPNNFIDNELVPFFIDTLLF